MRALPVIVLLAAACGGAGPLPKSAPPPEPESEPEPEPPRREGPPRLVKFDHILISFEGAPDDRARALRSKEEAEDLAFRLLDRVKAGVDFDLLKREYSDDRSKDTGAALGPYDVVNDGVRSLGRQIPRKNYYKAIGDLIFSLDVGEVGIAKFHPKHCPQGWHVVKRLE